MRAELKGDPGRIKIEPQQNGDLEQTFDPSGRMDWRWDVTPTRAGPTVLHLVLYVGVVVPPNPETHFSRIRDVTIPVAADWAYELRQFSSANWQWLASALVIPAGLWPIGSIRRRRKAQSA